MTLHPGSTVEETKEATGWDLKVTGDLDTTEPPTQGELRVLRDLEERTAAARKEKVG